MNTSDPLTYFFTNMSIYVQDKQIQNITITRIYTLSVHCRKNPNENGLITKVNVWSFQYATRGKKDVSNSAMIISTLEAEVPKSVFVIVRAS